MGELEDRINSVLSDPEQMEKISRLAGSLMGGGEQPAPTPEGDILGKISRLMASEGEGQKRERALLEAMKPYMSEKRKMKMDKALRFARLASIARTALGEMEAGDGDKPI